MKFLGRLFLVLVFAFTTAQAFAADVVLDNEPLFELQFGVGSFTAEERAQAVAKRLDQLMQQQILNFDAFTVEDFENTSNVLYQDRVLFTATNADAKNSKKTRSVYANEIKNQIIAGLQKSRDKRSVKQLSLAAAYAAISTLCLLFILWAFGRIFPTAQLKVQQWSADKIPSLTFRNYVLVPASRMVGFLVACMQGLRVVLTLLVLYFYIPLVLSFFPYTAGWADKIYGYVMNPVVEIFAKFVDYIPSLFFLGVIVLMSKYLLNFFHLVFQQVENGNIKITGFYPDWAMPTYQLVRFLVLAFTLVVAFPYLPGSGSPAFQGVSMFFGLLLSLGSTSAISNIVGGVVLTYMRPFKLGDRVRIADTMGDVIEKNLLVTRIRTVKNVDVTIPNSMVLGSHIINHSAAAKDKGLILSTTVTLGYDIDWRQVHKTLIRAATSVEGVLESPTPFVLQTALNDFYVAYELNAYTDQPNKMAVMYSRLHESIQDACAADGIEIMSPHYTAFRDGSEIAIPKAKSEMKPDLSNNMDAFS